MLKALFLSVIFALALSSSRRIDAAPQTASPEMTRLREALSGIWSVTVRIEPSDAFPKGGQARGRGAWRPGPGSLSLIEEFYSIGAEGEVSGLGVTWWDKAAQTYPTMWCDSGNADGCRVIQNGAKWEGGQLVLMKERQTRGMVFFIEEVLSDLTPTSFQKTVYEREGGREFRKVMSIRATRLKPDSGHTRVPSPLWPAEKIRRLRMPGPAVQNSMLGTWSIRVQEESSAQGTITATGQGTEVWWPGPGGYSVIEEYHQHDANRNVDAFGPAWWDAAAGGQRFVWCSSTEPNGCVLSRNVARWEGNRNVYTEEREEGALRVTSREIFEDISATSFTQVIQTGASAGELRTVRTIRAAKVSSAYQIYDWEKLGPFTPAHPSTVHLRR